MPLIPLPLPFPEHILYPVQEPTRKGVSFASRYQRGDLTIEQEIQVGLEIYHYSPMGSPSVVVPLEARDELYQLLEEMVPLFTQIDPIAETLS